MGTLEEAMAEAVALSDDELITPVNNILMINPETREIIIPETEKLFGIKFDVDVERKHFKCPKIVGDNIDLSQHKIYVVYQIVDEKGNVLSETPNPKMYWCEDMQTDETGDYITFSWQLSGNVFESSGIVGFKIVATYTDTETGNVKTRWNTIPAYGTVKMTLSNGEEIVEQYADVITQLLQRMDEVEAIATPEAMQGYVEQYFDENPLLLDETLTADDKAAPANLVGELKDDLEQLKQNGTSTGTRLSTEAINKLEEVGNYLAYTTADGGSKWTELISILRNGSSGGGSGETVPATGITLDKTTLSFTDSTSQTLVATVEPSDTTDKVVWTSNAESVATVTNGVVKPLSNGSATITATCGSVSATCSVTVDIAEEEPVILSSISATYTGGDVTVGTALTDLTGITVTGTYSDGSTSALTGYSLSGEIVEGSNTITVAYEGLITTFNVIGVTTTMDTEPIDTTVVITDENYGWNSSHQKVKFTGMGISKFYDVPSNSNITYYIASTLSSVSGVNKAVVYNDDTFVEYYSTIYNTLKANTNGIKTTTGNKVSFPVPMSSVADSYAYVHQTGEILFAGENTQYYGKRNVSEVA